MSQRAKRKPTWQEMTLFFVIAIGAVAYCRAWVDDISVLEKANARMFLFAVTLPLFVLLVLWDVYRITRRDRLPDVLAKQFAPWNIFEAGASHFVITTKQIHRKVTFTCTIQNLYFAETKFRLTLHPFKNASVLASQPPVLEVTLPPGAVVRAEVTLPLVATSLENRGEASWRLDAKASRGRGARVRFGRRAGILPHVPTAFRAFMLFAGHLSHGGGTFLTLMPAELPGDRVPDDSPREWQLTTIWKPSQEDQVQLTQRL